MTATTGSSTLTPEMVLCDYCDQPAYTLHFLLDAREPIERAHVDVVFGCRRENHDPGSAAAWWATIADWLSPDPGPNLSVRESLDQKRYGAAAVSALDARAFQILRDGGRIRP